MQNGWPGFLDFTKPGIDAVDDNVYPPFIRFWKRYGRNFLPLLQLNLVYALMTLPLYVWLTRFPWLRQWRHESPPGGRDGS